MSDLLANINAHNKYAFRYDKRHTDIFNEIEQERLRAAISSATSLCAEKDILALDFGCGTGNITANLAASGINVVSADISQNNLACMSSKLAKYTNLITPVLINGIDNPQLLRFRFHLIYVYSVLHHIPDYLALIASLAQLLKPNGVLVIDHEASPYYWQNINQYIKQTKYLANPIKYFLKRSTQAISPSYLRSKFIQQFVNPYFQPEGDIHVWPHDHIDWDKIDTTLIQQGLCEVSHSDYLVYKPIYNLIKYQSLIDSHIVPDMRIAFYQSL